MPGRLFVSLKDRSKTLFIPGACWWLGSGFNTDARCHIWSSTCTGSSAYNMWCLEYKEPDIAVQIDNQSRYNGFSIRGICD